MAQVYVPDSLPLDSQPSNSQQRYADYTLEATQLSQPHFSQTQNTQFANSQVEPRRKYWAVFVPISANHSILKIPWTKTCLQIGRGPAQLSLNDVVMTEKRISNKHCRITLGMPEGALPLNAVQVWKDGEGEPDVWIEDLHSSNGTFVNGHRIQSRVLLQHGDEVSLGHASSLENHDVRYIFRSVGGKGAKLGQFVSALNNVGEVYERYQLLDRLGKGTFAEVHRAVDVETGNMRAIKQIVKHRFAGNAKTMALFQREIEICTALQHENICRLIEYFEDPQHICLVLEYVDNGDLLDYIMNWTSANGGGLPEDHAADLVLQICRAMAFTHAKGITHRDLKPENILLTKPASAGVPPIVKVADFGLAKMVDANTMLTSMVGTPQYLAPEVVMQTSTNRGYENVVDSWSVGIIAYSMLTKALPFDEDGNLPVDQRIRARFTQPFDTALLHELNISQQAISFISRLLEKDPSKRMSMTEALEHEWLAGPSSQHSESSKLVLGGDSVWEIESFDDDDERNMSFDDGDARWSRPATVSGTNMESQLQHSDESFSQPMGNLRLGTPAYSFGIDSVAQSSLSPSASPEKQEDKPLLTIDSTAAVQDHALPTPPLSEHGPQKRKAGAALANGIDPFSSGSLSPPPPASEPEPEAEDKNATPRRSKRQTTKTPVSAQTKKGGKGGKDDKDVTPGPSPRRSTRPRKSMRLV